jgi:hypothetical protein
MAVRSIIRVYVSPGWVTVIVLSTSDDMVTAVTGVDDCLAAMATPLDDDTDSVTVTVTGSGDDKNGTRSVTVTVTDSADDDILNDGVTITVTECDVDTLEVSESTSHAAAAAANDDGETV